MRELDLNIAEFFYNNQEQLFDEPVAMDAEEALEFLEDCMAQVFDNKAELEEFIKDEGLDFSEYDDVTDALEVFELSDGGYLYVEA